MKACRMHSTDYRLLFSFFPAFLHKQRQLIEPEISVAGPVNGKRKIRLLLLKTENRDRKKTGAEKPGVSAQLFTGTVCVLKCSIIKLFSS